MHLVQTKTQIGEASVSIIEELLRSGSQTASSLLARCCDDKSTYGQYEDTFVELCHLNYIFRAPTLCESSTEAAIVPKFKIDENTLFLPPKLNAIEWLELRRDEKFPASDKGIT